jgi:NhaP-type Na+/H+ or K+/H+ antiporter
VSDLGENCLIFLISVVLGSLAGLACGALVYWWLS